MNNVWQQTAPPRLRCRKDLHCRGFGFTNSWICVAQLLVNLYINLKLILWHFLPLYIRSLCLWHYITVTFVLLHHHCYAMLRLRSDFKTSLAGLFVSTIFLKNLKKYIPCWQSLSENDLWHFVITYVAPHCLCPTKKLTVFCAINA